MEDISVTLKGWTLKEYLEEYENLPSDLESVVSDLGNDEEDVEEGVMGDVELVDGVLENIMDGVSDDDPDWNISLSELRIKLVGATWGQIDKIERPPEFTHASGITDIVRELQNPSPYNFFNSLFDDQIIENLVFQTNMYSNQNYQTSGKKFKQTNPTEIKVFLGINLLMGIKCLPSYKEYWSSSPDLHDAYISPLMPVNRFSWLLNHIHINDNNLMPNKQDPNFDKLYKVRPLLTKLSENFEKCLHPNKCMAVDESMIRFKGRSSLKQYMPKKPIKRGYKIWALADKSGYLYRFQIYTGKSVERVEKSLGANVVKTLTRGLEGKNHHLFIDNYFNSYKLLVDLKNQKFHTCGTVNSNRQNIPKMLDDKKLRRGEFDWKTSVSGLSVLKWKDNRCVHLLSNYHDPNETAKVKRRQKNGEIIEIPCPKVLLDYNANMNFVDRFDQLKSAYEINRKSHKWWHRIFFHFLDTCVVNAYVLYQLKHGFNLSQNEEEKNSPTNEFYLTQKDFRRKVVDGLLSKQIVSLKRKNNELSRPPLQMKKHKPTVPEEIRLESSAHQPIRGSRRRCAKCSTKAEQVRTKWMCSVCGVPLCLSSSKTCFQEFHGQ